MFEIERVRDRERKIGHSLHKGTKTLVRDRKRFEIEGVRDRESQLYSLFKILALFTNIPFLIAYKLNPAYVVTSLQLPMSTNPPLRFKRLVLSWQKQEFFPDDFVPNANMSAVALHARKHSLALAISPLYVSQPVHFDPVYDGVNPKVQTI